MANTDDTIVAVSSPPGYALRALVRISGPEVLAILARLLQPPNTSIQQLQAWPSPRRLITCHLQLPTKTPNENRCVSLPALVILYLGPRSYTGQDIAEIQCPGNPALLDRLIHRTIELGARLAQPGEFTFRAFLAGKLDLTQAEGVAATIAAVSDSQLRAAKLLRQGKLARLATDFVDRLANLLALVESGIDFVDQDDVVPISPRSLSEQLNQLIVQLDELIKRSRAWGTIDAIPHVVLIGPPSSGKSTLFNTLLKRQRSVVSPTAHTTRDAIIEPLTIQCHNQQQHVEVMLVDLAGLDEPGNRFDRQIQATTHRMIAQADLILNVSSPPMDQSTNQPRDDTPLKEKYLAPMIHVRTKKDLINKTQNQTTKPHGVKQIDVTVSGVTGEGVSQLRLLMADRLADRSVSVSSQMLALQPRHEDALNQAVQHLAQAKRILKPQVEKHALEQMELIAASMRQALDQLAGLGGQISPDDVLGKVFSTFCIGK